MAPETSGQAGADIQVRIERAHDEAYIRLPKKDMSWPAMLPACDALVCDLTIPLR